ncbi:MAG TPA: hypothetical protein VKA51_02640, partial [Rubrobacteraceae bacterium]|nr:hypothetical protein [Rubrobacteraceae bacterium]
MRPYERPVVALILVLLVALALLLPHSLPRIRASAEHTRAAVNGQVGPAPAGSREARPLGRAEHREGEELVASQQGILSPLCAPREDLLYAVDSASRTALTVDRDGRFALYGLADPDDGRPTRDSYEILAGCTVKGLPGNFASVLVGGRRS